MILIKGSIRTGWTLLCCIGLCTGCCGLFNARVYAQNIYLDSLKSLAGQLADRDNRKADVYHEIALRSWGYDFEEGLRYAQLAQEVARHNTYTQGSVQALSDIAHYYYLRGEYGISKQFCLQALDLAESKNFGNYPAYTLTSLGNLYLVQGMYDSARMFFDRSLALAKGQEGVASAKSWAYLNRGILFKTEARYDKAEEDLRQSLAIRTQLGDSILMAECWSHLASVLSATFSFDSAGRYLENLHQVATHYNHGLMLFHYHHRAAELAYLKGAYGESIDLYLKAIGFLKENEYKRYHAEILKQIGQIFREQGDFNRALEHFYNALEMNQSLNNKQGVAHVNNLIGWLYLSEKNEILAEEFGVRSLDEAKQINDRAGMADSYSLLGEIEHKKKNFNAAMDYYNRSLRIRRALKLGTEVCSTLFSMAKLYHDQGLDVKAVEFHEAIINLDRRKIDKRLLAAVYNSLAGIYLTQRNFDRAEACVREAAKIIYTIQMPLQTLENYNLYATLYQMKGDYRRAATYYREYIDLSDSIFSSESLSKAAQLSAVYQLSTKENEIRSLNQENEVKQAEIAMQQSRLALQRNILIFSVVGLIMLAVLAYVLFMYYRSKNKAHAELTKLHRDISEKNEEIQAQAEELIEANSSLTELNNRLIESQEEVQAQSEELMEANEMISDVNRDLEQKVQDRTEQLKQAYMELDTFFYRSSHDFRRPLTTFLGLAEVAKITVKNQNALELFEKVKDTALNLDKMLVKLQSISDVGTQQLAYKQIFLKELIFNIADSFRTELEQHAIKVNYDFRLTGEFYSYPVLVKIIVENLFENAINFCGTKNPLIVIRVFEHDRNVVVEVEDNGQGISTELADHIFDMYFRANHHSKGNGLGLYIVKKAVEKIQGEIHFTTELHQGSVFRVNIPRQRQ